eukprot:Gb_19286 [translate_table: standard]
MRVSLGDAFPLEYGQLKSTYFIKSPSCMSQVYITSLHVLRMITFVIAFLLLLAGAALNDQHNEDESFFANYCYAVKTGVFAGGGVLSLVTVTFGIIYYIVSSTLKNAAAWRHQNQGIAMAQPQYGPSNAQPIFVPENVYAQYHENPQYYSDSQHPPPPVGQVQSSYWK